MRRRLAQQGFGADHGFRWRGGEISRLEGLSDAVFAFAVILLVVSLEVPETFDELLRVLRGFFAFAVCFAILFWVWYDHYRFFRRYGLADGVTTTLTGVLLFLVLFYVYPMKFVFTMLFDQLFGDAPANVIQPGQVPLLMLVYGAGFIAVQLVFILLSCAPTGWPTPWSWTPTSGCRPGPRSRASPSTCSSAWPRSPSSPSADPTPPAGRAWPTC
jgi:hypothetical protein